ncbi:hypothetical protein [Neisseria sp. Ec49-e6-T10]|uniref:hypothetical protein n=1 Tax=Neisseria sp. Ec49-e6-T10 TaxID=3140744 RepID=UPI003EBC35C5
MVIPQQIDETCQKPSGSLLVKPVKPEAPKTGSREDILNHVILYGEYTQTLESQVDQWIKLYGGQND